jgi:hypothetical protein
MLICYYASITSYFLFITVINFYNFIRMSVDILVRTLSYTK